MGYGDYIPTGGNHKKKPLTKAALKKIQENYQKADQITSEVKKNEAEELNRSKKDFENSFNIFL